MSLGPRIDVWLIFQPFSEPTCAVTGDTVFVSSLARTDKFSVDYHVFAGEKLSAHLQKTKLPLDSVKV
jgi:hypothetical protein